MRNRVSPRLGARSDQFSFGVRASRHNASRSDRAWILDLSSIRRRRCDPCPLGEDHELRHGCRTHLLHNAPAMDLDRPFGCAELQSNLFVEHAGNYAFEHVKLAWCERGQSITHLLALQALEPLLGPSLESPLDGTQEIFVLEGFRQIIDCAGFHRLHTSRHAGTARNENDLSACPLPASAS